MIVSNNAGERARWEVLWIRDRKVVRKDCGNDLSEAIRLYTLVKGRRAGATLRCKNMGHPPPAQWRPRIVQYKAKEELPRPKIVKRNGKRYRQTHKVVLKKARYVPMKKRNREGIWWCPYCREFRRFVKKKYIYVDATGNGGRKIKLHEPGMYCPLCDVSHRDKNVRDWNPMATQVFYEMQQVQTKSPARTVESRRQARRRKKRQEASR